MLWFRDRRAMLDRSKAVTTVGENEPTGVTVIRDHHVPT